MGTPDFAVASLSKLVDAGYQVVGVITAPDKAAGRGLKTSQSEVKKYAVEKNLKILQPPNLKDPQFLEELRSLHADLQVVVAFRMLPESVWNMPPLGTINLHASLLPQYRGAAPINWAIINGEKETGVTTFKLKHEIDTGDILLQQKIPIGEDETAGELYNRMKEIGAGLLLQTVKEISEHPLAGIPQEISSRNINQETGDLLHHAPKIFTETCGINWNKNAEEIFNLIRGLSPYPGAFTIFNDKTLKIFKAKKETTRTSNPAGEYETDYKSFLKFTCNDGFISVVELQLEGKKKMGVEEFLRGFRNLQ
jgi:methionyl-tRNA formyltransferase